MRPFSSPLLDQSTAKVILTRAVPVWTEFLEHLETTGGRLEFYETVPEAIAGLKISDYPRLYENEHAAGNLMAKAMLGADGAAAFDQELREATPEARGEALLEIGEVLRSLEPAFDLALSAEAKAAQLEAFQALPSDEQQRQVVVLQHMFMGILATFYEQLSIMVHGEKLSSLVRRAKAGDDDAFLKAIQIDSRILAKIAYFDERYQRARMTGDASFITKVSNKLKAPPYAGRLEHKKLWLTLAWLDGARLLDAYSGDALLDLCIEIGAIDDSAPVDDVKNLLKLKQRFRAFQKGSGVSTP